MVTLDRIRLTGLLRRIPASAGILYLGRAEATRRGVSSRSPTPSSQLKTRGDAARPCLLRWPAGTASLISVPVVHAGEVEVYALVHDGRDARRREATSSLSSGEARRGLPISACWISPSALRAQGQVVEEAMSCSLPVISTERAGQIRDRLADGVEGFIVPPENSAALLDRMERLMLDSDLRRRMGEASARRVARYTPEHWAQQFEEAVSYVLTLRASPAG